MKIAIVGAGIAGLSAARELHHQHEVHLFDAAGSAGGHAHTVWVEEGAERFPVDMGFIVFNDRNYPIFSSMLEELGVTTAPSCMGFSVSDRASGLEYSGESLGSLFATPSNLFRPDFWRLLRDFRRFCRSGQRALEEPFEGTIGDFVAAANLSSAFQRLFLCPMAGAIWSTPPEAITDFPAASLLRFFERHGLLSVRNRPNWRTIQGGSVRYVDALLQHLDIELHLNRRVESVERNHRGARLRIDGAEAAFDQVILALHSDRALGLLADPSVPEVEILSAIPYRKNEVVLHRDSSLLPRRRRAWTSWNVNLEDPNACRGSDDRVAVTYLMNKLQPLPTATPWCVSLNQTERIAPAAIHTKRSFAHPQFDRGAIRAQTRWSEISGIRNTHYCGAYWRYGFHEDGAWSGQRSARILMQSRDRAA